MRRRETNTEVYGPHIIWTSSQGFFINVYTKSTMKRMKYKRIIFSQNF